MSEQPHYAVIANHRTGTSPVTKGARVYICHIPGSPDRCLCKVRSRGGRWIEVWVPLKKLDTFRVTGIYPGHRLYEDPWFDESERAKQMLERIQLVLANSSLEDTRLTSAPT